MPAVIPEPLRERTRFVLADRLYEDPKTGCWQWTRGRTGSGYGAYSFTFAGRHRTYRVHRLVYELALGPIPDGLTLDHLCANRLCANPDHLEPVTAGENSRRKSAAITHCKWGHQFDEENTLRRTHRDGTPQRVCIACERRRKIKARGGAA